MAHGTPDWGQTAGVATVFQLTDLAELAARLGSPAIFHRSGDVLFMDGFENGLRGYYTEVSGANAAVDLQVANVLDGQFCCRLLGGSDSSRYALVRRQLAVPSLAPLGFEFAFAPQTVIALIELRITFYTGAQQLDAAIRWHVGDSELQYLNSSSVWTAFSASFALFQIGRLYHVWKLVFDPTAQAYMKVIVDNQLFSLADIGTVVAVETSNARVEVTARVDSRSGFVDSAHVDRLIVTQNEPA